MDEMRDMTENEMLAVMQERVALLRMQGGDWTDVSASEMECCRLCMEFAQLDASYWAKRGDAGKPVSMAELAVIHVVFHRLIGGGDNG
jgi:hypothetical protein